VLKKFIIFRDILVRKTYEETLSSCIAELIIKNSKRESKVKVLDFGSGFDPSVLQLVRGKLSLENINLSSHGYDLYDEAQLNELNQQANSDEKYFFSSDISKNNVHYDFVVISDVLHHLDIDKQDEIKKIITLLKSKSNYLIIKDHFQYGFLSNQILRFMDFFGNFFNKTKTPKRYYKKKEFEDLIYELKFQIKERIVNRKYHSKYFFFLSNIKYHFVYLIE
jgi:2-polyprenyl-3-methyl-5-hydroxy-6-metoxy-1,4-benzoquinol methylase